LENTETINIRVSKELKEAIDKQAQQRGQTISDYVRELLTKHVTQGDDYISGIPPELLEKITAESQRRRRPESYILQAALRYAFDNLFVNPWWVRW